MPMARDANADDSFSFAAEARKAGGGDAAGGKDAKKK